MVMKSWVRELDRWVIRKGWNPNKYSIISKIDEGGQGEVWKVEKLKRG